VAESEAEPAAPWQAVTHLRGGENNLNIRVVSLGGAGHDSRVLFCSTHRGKP
jgi:hypothetical protein